jgi:hypothetical protein
MVTPDNDDQRTESLYDSSSTPPWHPGSSVDFPPLSGVPFYLPNLIAAIVASVGIIIGSIGTWAVADGTTGLGGMDVPGKWGIVTLVLGAASAIALFAQLNWGRTSFRLRWAVPLVWAVVVLSVGCLAIGLVHIATVSSLDSFLRLLSGHTAQVGWGLWLVAICAALLAVTTAIVAVQVGIASQDHIRPSQAGWASAWRWAAIGGSAVILVIAVLNSYRPVFGGGGSEEATATETETVTARPSPATETETVAAPSQRVQLPSPVPPGSDGVLPTEAKHCTSNPVSVMFNNSAAGNDVTSCQFAESVRGQYVQQTARRLNVTLNVFSPVTNQNYIMTCTGSHIVMCTGGNSAVVYIY